MSVWPGLDVPFPLSTGQLALIRLPNVPLTHSDAERLGAFIRLLPIDAEPTARNVQRIIDSQEDPF